MSFRAPLTTGEELVRSQRIELASGFAEIAFNSGAQVTLEGPVSLDVRSARDAVLHHGTRRADSALTSASGIVSHPARENVCRGHDLRDVGTDGLHGRGSARNGGEGTKFHHRFLQALPELEPGQLDTLQDATGRTVLHILATRSHQARAIPALVDGADINDQYPATGWHILYSLADWGPARGDPVVAADNIGKLLERGASLSIRNKQGLTLLGVAEKYGRTEMAAYLRSLGAKD